MFIRRLHEGFVGSPLTENKFFFESELGFISVLLISNIQFARSVEHMYGT
jgi:hypothetical protein